jgi:proline utilization trans-activator
VTPSHIIPDYLGTSSDWSFTGRIRILTHQQVNKTPLPAQSLLFDGAVYDINWDDPPGPTTTPMLPTLYHAIYLINSVKFNCGQIFHLVEEEDFMQSCHKFYASPTPDLSSAGLWYVHFCLVIALGKALLARPQRGSALPCGHDFFISVFRRIPNQGALIKQPLVSIEILCCAALYLQSIDRRLYANILVRALLAQLQETKP